MDNHITRNQLRTLIIQTCSVFVALVSFVYVLAEIPETRWIVPLLSDALDVPLLVAVATFLLYKAGLFGWSTRLAYWLCLTNIVFSVLYYYAVIRRLMPFDSHMDGSFVLRVFLLWCLVNSAREMTRLRGGIVVMWRRRRFPRVPRFIRDWLLARTEGKRYLQRWRARELASREVIHAPYESMVQ